MENSRKKATAFLTQIYGEATNRKFKLMCSKITIGRGFHADIRLKNPNISRNHCTLYYSAKGWTVTDNKSQNGTYISGKQLKRGESRLLQCGDIIFLGPPSEMPEAFCYDDAFVEDEDILDTGHEIIELPPVKRFVQEEVTASKKKRLVEISLDTISNKIVSPLAAQELVMDAELEVSHFVEVSDCSQHKFSNEEILLQKNKNLSPVQSVRNLISSSQLNEVYTMTQTSQSSSVDALSSKNFGLNEVNTVSQTSHSFSVALSPKKLRLDNSDSGYQINEISSTGYDQDSLSLLDVKKNDIVEPSCSNSDEAGNIPMAAQDSQTVSELDLLKSKLALLTDQMKKIEESKLNLLKNYEVVCEKNFALDQQLSEKKKIEEDLKSCEMKVQDKIKNELLEKFEEDLICNICTELLIKPTVLDCSHTFCLYCIKEWKKKKNECPICRHKIVTMTPVLTLEHFIDKTLSTLTPDQKERRNQLIRERENQPKKSVTPTSRRRRHGRRRFRQPIVTANFRPQAVPSTIAPASYPVVSVVRQSAATTITPANHPLVSLNQQSLPATNRESDVEIVGERRNNLPYPFSRIPIQMLLSNLRIPEVLLGSQ